MQQNISPFILTRKQKQLLMRVILMMHLYYDYIKHTKKLGKGSGWIIDSVLDHIVKKTTRKKYNKSDLVYNTNQSFYKYHDTKKFQSFS